MDYDEMISQSKYSDQSDRGLLQSQYRFLYHPLLMPNNHWLWKFVPGVLVGFFLKSLLRGGSRKKKRAAEDFEDDDGERVDPVKPGEEVRLILVVNKELKSMKSGKMAAQCGHAAAMVVKKLMSGRHGNLMQQWENCGQPKIVVKGQSRAELEDIAAKARQAGMMTTAVLDAGRTQVEAGSMTVMAVGPAPRSKLEPVTGDLPLM